MDNARLLGLIKEHSWTKYHKVLTCAPDVEQFLQRHASPIGQHEDTVLMSLMSIDVVVAGDSAPGTWQLIRHDHCQVRVVTDDEGHTDLQKSGVSHQDCTIIATEPSDPRATVART